jgi:hypothetical protein
MTFDITPKKVFPDSMVSDDEMEPTSVKTILAEIGALTRHMEASKQEVVANKIEHKQEIAALTRHMEASKQEIVANKIKDKQEKTEHKQEIAALTRHMEANKQEIVANKIEHKQEIAANKIEHKQEIAANKIEHKQEIDANKIEHEQEIVAITRKMEANKQEIVANKIEHKQEIAANKIEHEQEIVAITRKMEANKQEIVANKIEHKQEIAANKIEHKQEIVAITRKMEALETKLGHILQTTTIGEFVDMLEGNFVDTVRAENPLVDAEVTKWEVAARKNVKNEKLNKIKLFKVLKVNGFRKTEVTPLRDYTNATPLPFALVEDLSQELLTLKKPRNEQSHTAHKEYITSADKMVRVNMLAVVKKAGKRLYWSDEYTGAVRLRIEANIDKTQTNLREQSDENGSPPKKQKTVVDENGFVCVQSPNKKKNSAK